MASGRSGDRQKKRGRRLKNVFLLYIIIEETQNKKEKR